MPRPADYTLTMRKNRRVLTLLLCLLTLESYVRAEGPQPTPPPVQTGEASYYGKEFTGKKTASGERFDPNDHVAAHPSLPLGTEAKVVNLENGKETRVEINDRGPHVKSRVIDVSPKAAKELGMVKDGTAKVKVVPVATPARTPGS